MREAGIHTYTIKKESYREPERANYPIIQCPTFPELGLPFNPWASHPSHLQLAGQHPRHDRPSLLRSLAAAVPVKHAEQRRGRPERPAGARVQHHVLYRLARAQVVCAHPLVHGQPQAEGGEGLHGLQRGQLGRSVGLETGAAGSLGATRTPCNCE